MFGATWRVAAFILAFALAAAPIGFALSSVINADGGPLSPGVQIGLDAAGLAAVLAATAVMQKLVDRGRLSDLGLAPRRFLPAFATGVGLGAAMILLAAALLVLAGWAAVGPDPSQALAGLAAPAASGVLNVATQDLLLAGYVFVVLQARFGSWAATVLASTLFVGLHAGALIDGSAIGAFNLFLAGVFLISCRLASGSLWLTMGAHFAWNFVQGPVLGVAVSGVALTEKAPVLLIDGPDWATGGAFGLEGGLAATAATLTGILTVWGVRLVTRKKQGRPVPAEGLEPPTP